MTAGIHAPDHRFWRDRLPQGCGCETLEGARWGALLTPPAMARQPAAATMQIVLFASFWIGQATLQAALAYQQRHPGRLRIVGVVTDDPVSPQARISLRKRAWSAMAEAERLEVKLALLRTALGAGIPVYTGEIKTAGFRRVLGGWQPDALVSCGFGQVLDRSILDLLPYGAYNCHPTDLANGHGAGPAPWDDMAARGVTHTVWSVHRMTEVVDAGPVIGQTPPINVADAAGRLSPDPRCFFYKVVPAVSPMVLALLASLVRRREAERPSPIADLDIAAVMTAALRRRLADPVAPDWRSLTIPTPGDTDFAALESGVLAEAAG